MIPRFTAADGPRIQELGAKSQKKKSPVYLMQIMGDCEVETAEGVMQGHAGDNLAYDPKSGHVWIINAEYTAMHYESWVD